MLLKESTSLENNLLTRLDHLPIWPYPYSWLMIIGAGFFFAGLDMFATGFAIPVIAHQMRVPTTTAVWAISATLLGYLIGAYSVSRFSDNHGRRHGLIIATILIYSRFFSHCASTQYRQYYYFPRDYGARYRSRNGNCNGLYQRIVTI